MNRPESHAVSTEGDAIMMAWLTVVLGILVGAVCGYLTGATIEYLGDARTLMPNSVIRVEVGLGSLAGLACAVVLGTYDHIARKHLDIAVPATAAVIGVALGVDGPHLLIRLLGHEVLRVPSAMSSEQLLLGLAALMLAIPRALVFGVLFATIGGSTWAWFRRWRWREEASWPRTLVYTIPMALSGATALALVIVTLAFYQSCWGMRAF